MQNSNIIVQRNGSTWAVGIMGNGDNQALKYEFFGWYNHGAAACEEPNWIGENFFWFWSNAKRLKDAIFSRTLMRVLNESCDSFKGVRGGVYPHVSNLAQETWESIDYNASFSLIPPRNDIGHRVASTHDMEASRPDYESNDYELADR